MTKTKKRRLLKITSIFVVLEAALMYYVVGLLLVGYRPGHILLGFNPEKTVNFVIAYTYPLRYLLGLSNVLKTFFPLYWNYVYHFSNEYDGLPISSQVADATHFLLAFWVGLIVAAIITAVVYAIKLKGALRAFPRIPLPSV